MFNNILSTIGASKGKIDKQMLDEYGKISPIWYMTQEFSRLSDNIITQSSELEFIRIIFENTGVFIEIIGFDAIKNLHGINCISDTKIQIDAVDKIYNMKHITVDSDGKVSQLKHRGR